MMDFDKVRGLKLKKHGRNLLRETIVDPKGVTLVAGDGSSRRRYGQARVLERAGLLRIEKRRRDEFDVVRLHAVLTPLGKLYVRRYCREIFFGGPINAPARSLTKFARRHNFDVTAALAA